MLLHWSLSDNCALNPSYKDTFSKNMGKSDLLDTLCPTSHPFYTCLIAFVPQFGQRGGSKGIDCPAAGFSNWYQGTGFPF